METALSVFIILCRPLGSLREEINDSLAQYRGAVLNCAPDRVLKKDTDLQGMSGSDETFNQAVEKRKINHCGSHSLKYVELGHGHFTLLFY